MAQDLGTLQYDLTIDEKNLDKTIKDIDAKLKSKNKDWEKYLSVDFSQATKGAISYQKILREQEKTEKQRFVAAQQRASASSIAEASAARTAEVARKSAANALADEQRLAAAKARTTKAQLSLEQAQKRAAAQADKTSSSYKKQSLYLQNLNTLAASYASIFAVARIADKIREVTGEFELQNKALGAILQNKEKADQLFGQVTDLALKSPFAIKELLTYTKQLAAYRIETENLIPTLTQLADVSAGLGVDMSRLILAYGQVRAASVLRGTELRQFTEAGIPLVQLLADKFSILEGRVVATNEVFDKISNRMVSFEMVADIFEEMTQKGGLFFEAQAVQARTLAGMWNILGDAIDKAMYQIGTENMDILKGAVQGATDLTRSWRDVLDIIKTLIATYGVFAISMRISNGLIIKNKVATALMSVATKEAAVAQGLLTAAEAAHISTAKKLGIAMQSLSVKMKAIASGNWVGLLLTALTAIGVALYNAKQRSDEAREAFEKSISPLLAQSESLEKISEKLNDTNTSEQERIKLLKEAEKATDGAIRANEDEVKSLQAIADQIEINRGIAAIKAVEFDTGDKAKKAKEELEKQSKDLDSTISLIEGKFLLFKQVLRDADLAEPLREQIDDILKNNKDFKTEADKAVAIYKLLGVEIAEAQQTIRAKRGQRGTEYFSVSDLNRLKEEKDALEDLKSSFDISGEVADFTKQTRLLQQATYDTEVFASRQLVLIQETASEIAKKTGGDLDVIKQKLLEAFGLSEADKRDVQKTFTDIQRTITKVTEDFKDLRGIEDISFGLTAQIKDDQAVSDYFKSILRDYDAYKQKVLDIEKVESAIAKNKIERSEDEIKAAKNNLEAAKNLEGLYAALIKVFGISKKKQGDADSAAVRNLREQVKLLTDIKKAREDISVSLGKDETEEAIQKIFRGRAKDLGITIPITSDATAFYDQLKAIAIQADKLGTDAGKALAKAINAQISKSQTKDLVDNAKQAIKDINDEISAYKGKVDFYNDILGISKDEEFSFKLAFDIDTDGLDRIIRDKIAELDRGIELGIGEDIVGKSFEDLFTKSEIQAAQTRIGEENIEEIKKLYAELSKIQDKSFKDELTRLAAVRKEFRGAEEEKVAIRAKYNRLRSDLDSEYNNQTAKEREATLKRLGEAESLELAKVDATILASTRAYKELYSDMERFSIKRMKRIRDEWEGILAQLEATPAIDGKKFIKIDGKDVEFDVKLINRITKAVLDLDSKIAEKNPFEKIRAGIKGISGEDWSEAVELMGDGAKDLLNIISPLSDALRDLGEATGDTGLINLADDLRLAVEWTEELINLGTGIAEAFATGDPTKVIQSLVNITAKLIRAEAEYQKSKRAFLADQLRMQREYTLLIIQEQALFKEGMSIFDINQFGQAANQINVLRDATESYTDEMNKLGAATVKTGVERKKFLGITIGKKDVYGLLLEQFPEIIKNQDDIIKKTVKWNKAGLELEGTMFKVGKNAEIDVNVAKSILATEKLNDATRATLEQLIALQEEIDKANQAISDYLGSIFGELGNELSDAIIQAFRDGDQASLDFADNVASTMEKLAQDIGNSLILAPYFKKFQEELERIYKDQTLTPEQVFEESSRVMADFYAGLEEEQKKYTDFLQQSQEEAAKFGIDIFGDQEKELGALARGIQGVTEDTARRLEALLNSIREVSIGDSGKMSEIVAAIGNQTITASQSIAHLQSIDNNVLAFRSAFESVLTNAQNTGGTGIKVYMQ